MKQLFLAIIAAVVLFDLGTAFAGGKGDLAVRPRKAVGAVGKGDLAVPPRKAVGAAGKGDAAVRTRRAVRASANVGRKLGTPTVRRARFDLNARF